MGEGPDVISQYDVDIYIVANSIIVSPRGFSFLYARRVLRVGRWWRILRAFDVETSVFDINLTRPPKCILGYKWAYWMLVSTLFLYDRCVYFCFAAGVSPCSIQIRISDMRWDASRMFD